MKSLKNKFLILLSLFVLPFSIASVFSSWTYYEGEVDPVEVELNISLKEFFYNDLNEGFDETPSGHINSSTIDKIIDSNTGANNNETPLNNVLQRDLPNSGFVTSIDDDSSPVHGYPILSGDNLKETLGIGKDSHFLIKLEQNSQIMQTWYVYTTDYPIEQLKVIEDVDENGNVTQRFNYNYIYDVYRSTMTWVTDFFDGGTYTLVQNETQKGYAQTAINEINNPVTPFFSPSSWRAGTYVQGNSVTIDGPETVYTDQLIKYNVNFDPIGTTDQSVKWSSSNDKIAKIDSNGILTPMSVGNVTITAKPTDLAIKPVSFDITIEQRSESLPTSITIDGMNNVVMGKQHQYTATVYPSGVSNKNVIWSTSDENIATIDKDGLLTVKELKEPTMVTIYAKSVLNDVIGSVSVHVGLPLPNNDYNGRNEIKNGKLVYFNAKDVNINESGYVYPIGTTNQAIKVVIPKSNNLTRYNIEFNSSVYAGIVNIYAMDEDNNIELYNNNTLVNNQYSNMTYFITFMGSQPIEYKITQQ